VSSLAEGTKMMASSNWQYALLREKQIERNWRVGLAKITARYDSYSAPVEIFTLNKGILERDASAVMLWNRDPVPDTDPARRIDEIYFDDTDDCYKKWVRVQGNNGWPLVTANLRIRAVLDAATEAVIGSLVGLVNSDDCSALGSAGTLWFNKFNSRQRKRGWQVEGVWYSGVLFDCVIGLAKDAAGWSTRTLAQLQKYGVVQHQLEDKDGVAVEGQFLPVGSWKKDSAATTEMPPAGEPVSFSAINTLLT